MICIYVLNSRCPRPPGATPPGSINAIKQTTWDLPCPALPACLPACLHDARLQRRNNNDMNDRRENREIDANARATKQKKKSIMNIDITVIIIK